MSEKEVCQELSSQIEYLPNSTKRLLHGLQKMQEENKYTTVKTMAIKKMDSLTILRLRFRHCCIHQVQLRLQERGDRFWSPIAVAKKLFKVCSSELSSSCIFYLQVEQSTGNGPGGRHSSCKSYRIIELCNRETGPSVQYVYAYQVDPLGQSQLPIVVTYPSKTMPIHTSV